MTVIIMIFCLSWVGLWAGFFYQLAALREQKHAINSLVEAQKLTNVAMDNFNSIIKKLAGLR